MDKEITLKKDWETPEVMDLDVNDTEKETKTPSIVENFTSGPPSI